MWYVILGYSAIGDKGDRSMEYNNTIHTHLLNATRSKWESIAVSFIGRPRTYFSFLYLVSGRIDYMHDGKTHSLSKGDIFFLPRGGEYTIGNSSLTKQAEFLIVDFDTDSFDIHSSPIPPFAVFHDEAGRYIPLMENAVFFYQKGGYHHLITQAAVYQLMHIFLSMNHRSSVTNVIEEAKNVLSGDNNYSIDEIAQMLFISSSNFRKKFSAATGKSPSRYRLEKRIEKAKSMLQTGAHSIGEIAILCQFYDLSHFYKVFEKETGLTPKEYQNRCGDL